MRPAAGLLALLLLSACGADPAAPAPGLRDGLPVPAGVSLDGRVVDVLDAPEGSWAARVALDEGADPLAVARRLQVAAVREGYLARVEAFPEGGVRLAGDRVGALPGHRLQLLLDVGRDPSEQRGPAPRTGSVQVQVRAPQPGDRALAPGGAAAPGDPLALDLVVEEGSAVRDAATVESDLLGVRLRQTGLRLSVDGPLDDVLAAYRAQVERRGYVVEPAPVGEGQISQDAEQDGVVLLRLKACRDGSGIDLLLTQEAGQAGAAVALAVEQQGGVTRGCPVGLLF